MQDRVDFKNETANNSWMLPIDPEKEMVLREDLTYLSSLVDRNEVTNAEIRLSSAILRRLIIYRELEHVATARKIRLRIKMPETKDLANALNKAKDLLFFQLGSHEALGATVSGFAYWQRTEPPRLPYDPQRMYEASIKAFEHQPVFAARLTIRSQNDIEATDTLYRPISRESVIRYVANKTGGTHYDDDRVDPNDVLLDAIRRAVSMSRRNQNEPMILIEPKVFTDPAFREAQPVPGQLASSTRLDPVLIELLGTARFMIESPRVSELRELLGT